MSPAPSAGRAKRRPWLETLLLRAALGLRQHRRHQHPANGDRAAPPGCLVRLLQVAHGLNLVALPLVAALLFGVGERWWLSGLLGYFPVWPWLLPTVALVLPTAWLAPRWLVVNAGAALLGLWLLAFPVWPGRASAPAPGDLVVVTNNFGQHNRQSIRPFVETHQPDLLLLQEAFGRGPAFGQAYPGYHWKAHGEFVLLSRYPIVESGLLPNLQLQAARFVIDRDGERIAIYNVHLASPRRDLNQVLSARTLWEIVTGQSGPTTRRATFRIRLDQRIAHALDLRDRIAAEPLPYLVGGDFNLPARAWLYRQLTRDWTDAHRAAGFGLGYTFPGETSSWLALRRPWLRIDYLFSGPGWTVEEAATERRRPAQHRGVAARFRPAREVPAPP